MREKRFRPARRACAAISGGGFALQPFYVQPVADRGPTSGIRDKPRPGDPFDRREVQPAAPTRMVYPGRARRVRGPLTPASRDRPVGGPDEFRIRPVCGNSGASTCITPSNGPSLSRRNRRAEDSLTKTPSSSLLTAEAQRCAPSRSLDARGRGPAVTAYPPGTPRAVTPAQPREPAARRRGSLRSRTLISICVPNRTDGRPPNGSTPRRPRPVAPRLRRFWGPYGPT